MIFSNADHFLRLLVRRENRVDFSSCQWCLLPSSSVCPSSKCLTCSCSSSFHAPETFRPRSWEKSFFSALTPWLFPKNGRERRSLLLITVSPLLPPSDNNSLRPDGFRCFRFAAGQSTVEHPFHRRRKTCRFNFTSQDDFFLAAFDLRDSVGDPSLSVEKLFHTGCLNCGQNWHVNIIGEARLILMPSSGIFRSISNFNVGHSCSVSPSGLGLTKGGGGVGVLFFHA